MLPRWFCRCRFKTSIQRGCMGKAGLPLGEFNRAKRIISPRKNSSKRACIFHYTSEYLHQSLFHSRFGARTVSFLKFDWNMAAALNLRYLLLLKLRLIRILLLRRRQIRLQKYRKRFWIRKVYNEREEKGEYHLLVKELRLQDADIFRSEIFRFPFIMIWLRSTMLTPAILNARETTNE